jgi:hypothetical protein
VGRRARRARLLHRATARWCTGVDLPRAAAGGRGPPRVVPAGEVRMNRDADLRRPAPCVASAARGASHIRSAPPPGA